MHKKTRLLPHLAFVLIAMLAGCNETTSKPKAPPIGSDVIERDNQPLSKEVGTIPLPRFAFELRFADDALYWIQTEEPLGTSELLRYDLATGTQKVLLRGQLGALAVDGSHLFTNSMGRLIRLDTATGQELVLVAQLQHRPIQIEVDDTHVYWATMSTFGMAGGSSPWHPGAISRVSRSGGDVEVLTEMKTSPSDMAILGDKVYWTADGVYSIDKDGGSVVTIVDGPIPRKPEYGGAPISVSYPNSLTVDNEFVYFSAGDGAYKAPRTGAAPKRIYTASIVLSVLKASEGLVVVRNSAFLGKGEQEEGGIALLENGKAKELVLSHHASWLALGHGVLYFIESPFDGKGNSIRSVRLRPR